MGTRESWAALTPHEKLIAVGSDAGKHPRFSALAPILMLGKRIVTHDVPTAATNGENEMYNPDFIDDMPREQLRYLRYHEGVHKYLLHCTPMYAGVVKKYPQLSYMAMDYVVNAFIEKIDNGEGFIERPTKVAPLVDPKYTDWSWMQVMEDLMKNQPPPPPGGQPGEGGGNGGFDKHIMSDKDGDELGVLKRKVEDAVVQGKMLSDRLSAQAGNEGGGAQLPSNIFASTTRWQEALLSFLQETIKGDDFSRYNPPNRRLMPLGILMPSHFTECMGELVIAADTSGSMTYVLPQVLGEIVSVCKVATPSKVHLIWWDTSVGEVQAFLPDQYADIANSLRPCGGGGTTPSVVTDYLLKHPEINPAALVWLTDGDFYEAPHLMPKVPQIWGVIGSHPFKAPKGKVLRIPAVF